MKKWTPALVPLLLLSCADNELQPPGSVTPSLQIIAAPARVVAGWPTPLELRVEAELPDAEAGRFAVQVLVDGPGLDAPRLWTLADDGSAADLASPGDGQLARSGDNVPGDGVFTARFDSGFSAELGDFALSVRLLDGGALVDSRATDFERVVDAVPTLSELAAPDTLASGATLQLNVVAVDPDGAADLVGVQLETTGGVMRSWSFAPAADDHWTLSVGPEIAAGLQGPTGFAVVAVDQAGQSASLDLSIVLENEPPVLDGEALQFFVLGIDGFETIPTEDTIHLYVPSLSPADSNYYRMDIPISDPQTNVDLSGASWTITAVDNPAQTVTWDMSDEDGDGVYTGFISLAGRPTPYTFHVYTAEFVAEDAFGSASHQRFIELHDFVAGAPGPGGPSSAAGAHLPPSRPAAGGFAR